MSTDTESFVVGSPGPVNTGTGHQFNGVTFNFDAALQRFMHGEREPRAIAHEHLLWLNRRFVEPRHYGRARDWLADSGNVLLTGVPGSGRRAAAQMLLHRLFGTDGQIRELSDGSDRKDSSDEPVLDTSTVGSGQRLLLNLSLSEEKYYSAVLKRLPAFRTVVNERGAHLVVVLPYDRKQHLGSELGPSTVDISRPDGAEVFQRYLRSDGIRPTGEQLDVAELTVQLRSEPMRRIAELSGLVQLARESEPTQPLPHWLREALTALTERSDEIAKQMTQLRWGQQRALLLATAVFSGAHADAVFWATSRLCTIVRQPEDERPRLEREGVAEQLAEIGATADGAGLVRFRSLAYDQAVRTHFWTNFPEERDGFRDWVTAAVWQRTLTAEDRDEVVTRFAEQALRTGRPGDLLYLAERWVRRPDPRWPSRLLPQAAKALERGLSDERHGRCFRRRLYDWSRDPSLSNDLAQVVVQVCSEVLALTHPDQAVVRLHHIVRRQSGVAGDAARDALLDLTDRDRRMYRLLLERVTSGPKTTEYAVADLSMFLELADPVRLTDARQRPRPLIADETVRDQLVTGWAAVLGEPSSLPYGHHVRAWLVACLDDRYRELLLEDVWERERDHERRKRAYLGDDVLQSTGSAVVWWLAQHDNDVEGAVRLIGALAELSAAANDAEVPELFRYLVPPRHFSGSFDGDQQFPTGASHDGNHQAAGPAWAGFPAGQFPAASQFGAGLDRLNLGDDQSAHFAHRLARLIERLGSPRRPRRSAGVSTLPWPTSNRRPSPTPTTNCGTDPRPTRSHRCRRSHGETPHCRMSRSRTTISRQTTSPGRSRLTSHEGER